MPTNRPSTIASIVRAVGLEIVGRLHFDLAPVGQVIAVDGEHWTIFRKLRLVDFGLPAAQAIVEARFTSPKSLEHNRWTSMMAIPLFAGLPGFRSKIWMHNGKGDFRVVYEWQTLEDAQRFASSRVVRMVGRHSTPGSLKVELLELPGLA
jgi:hypothetical protein